MKNLSFFSKFFNVCFTPLAPRCIVGFTQSAPAFIVIVTLLDQHAVKLLMQTQISQRILAQLNSNFQVLLVHWHKNICVKFGWKQPCTRNIVTSHLPTYLKTELNRNSALLVMCSRHGVIVIVIDYSFLSNRNRLD